MKLKTENSREQSTKLKAHLAKLSMCYNKTQVASIRHKTQVITIDFIDIKKDYRVTTLCHTFDDSNRIDQFFEKYN